MWKRLFRRGPLVPALVPPSQKSPRIGGSSQIGPSDEVWEKDERVPEAMRRQWIEDGFVVFPQMFPEKTIEKYNRLVTNFRKTAEESKDAHGYGQRIGMLHQTIPDLLVLASHPEILRFLDWAFGEDPILMGSLNFESGSQQSPHIDAIFFYTEPIFCMAGLWIALEDIHAEAGPLFYVPGSHKWPFLHGEDLTRKKPELKQKIAKARSGELEPTEVQAIVNELGTVWSGELEKTVKDAGVGRAEPLLRKGDAAIWHAKLVHGGTPRKDPALSRKSAVFHFIGKTANLYPMQEFFLNSRAEILESPGLPST